MRKMSRMKATDILYTMGMEDENDYYTIGNPAEQSTLATSDGVQERTASKAVDVLVADHLLHQRDVVNSPHSIFMTRNIPPEDNHVLMTEIQLRQIVDRLNAK